MESRELDVRPEDREGGGPVAELVGESDPRIVSWPSTLTPSTVRNAADGVDFTKEVSYVMHADSKAPLIFSEYEDLDGRWWKVRIPLHSNAPPSMGIPVGPPDTSELNLPHDVGVRLHNQLFNRGLFTREDLRGRGQEVYAALQAAYRVDAVAVTALYR